MKPVVARSPGSKKHLLLPSSGPHLSGSQVTASEVTPGVSAIGWVQLVAEMVFHAHEEQAGREQKRERQAAGKTTKPPAPLSARLLIAKGSL